MACMALNSSEDFFLTGGRDFDLKNTLRANIAYDILCIQVWIWSISIRNVLILKYICRLMSTCNWTFLHEQHNLIFISTYRQACQTNPDWSENSYVMSQLLAVNHETTYSPLLLDVQAHTSISISIENQSWVRILKHQTIPLCRQRFNGPSIPMRC